MIIVNTPHQNFENKISSEELIVSNATYNATYNKNNFTHQWIYFVNELFKSLRSKYQENLETSVKESDFIFDLVQLMYCKCYKVNFKCGGSYVGSPV